MAYLCWPYAALFNLYTGLETADKESVRGKIDWPPLIEGLKIDINRFIDFQLREKQRGREIQISFSSSALTQQIVKQVATPEGILFIYHHPDDFLLKIKEVFEKTADLKQLSPPEKEKPLKLESPNIPSLRDRIQYLFFTDLSNFRAQFKIRQKPFVIEMQRQGLSWKVNHLSLPLNH